MKHDLAIGHGVDPSADRLVIPPERFDDRRMSVSSGILAGGESVGPRRSDADREEVWIVLDGGVQTITNATPVDRNGPGALAGFARSRHGLANPGPRPIRYLRVAVGSRPAGESGDVGDLAEWQPLEPALLAPTNAHGGLGEIRFRRLWASDRFVAPWGFVDHAVIDPGTSVGYHRHDTVQECYLILSGSGVMKVDDTVFDVAAGEGVPNRLGGAHGILAVDDPVELVNVSLFTEGRFDATDLGDDLSSWLVR